MPDPVTSPQIFSGEYRHAIDDKNRVTVPSGWRRFSEAEEFFTVPDPHGKFLMVMPPEEFRGMSDRVKADTSFSPALKRSFIRQFYSRAKQCTTDRQGRILIPEDHRRQAGLESEVVLVGVHSRFEIWNPETWARVSADENIEYQKVADLVGL